MVRCVDCGRLYPEVATPHCCPSCGGLYDDPDPPPFDVHRIDPGLPGIWRYSASFGFPTHPALIVSLGEGRTPLVPVRAFGRDVFFKCEFANPTGSFKDRGMAPLLTFLHSRGVKEAVEDSSGNAGASFAAYAARAGIKARVFVPESASGPKRKQIEIYGAALVQVPGPRSAATEAAMQAVKAGAVYASHAFLPFNLPGYATCAYEIWEQLGPEVGAVISPAGQGGLLLGMARGFQALVEKGLMRNIPVMVGVQAEACAPLASLAGSGGAEPGEAATLAEGVRVADPLRKVQVVKAVLKSGGRFVRVEEKEIFTGRDAIARLGFYVEPTSALIWYALSETISRLQDPVVAVLTGSGYKYAV